MSVRPWRGITWSALCTSSRREAVSVRVGVGRRETAGWEIIDHRSSTEMRAAMVTPISVSQRSDAVRELLLQSRLDAGMVFTVRRARRSRAQAADVSDRGGLWEEETGVRVGTAPHTGCATHRLASKPVAVGRGDGDG